MSQLGIVAIGRNEGERLRRALGSVVGRGHPVAYVDGNSTDGSAELARSLGAEVIVEDPAQRNCAARARNAGFERVCQLDPDVRFVQFIDGDCEVVEGWLDEALRLFAERPDVALVTGRRRERHPEQSPYNRLADIEWDMPIGEIEGSHGDVMVRAEAFRQVGGFDPTVSVGEDYDLCVRLRKRGWTLLRVDAEMTLHDMAMTRFAQWWRRCVRSGYGFAEGAYLHGAPPQRHWVREVRRLWFWGLAVPLAILLLAGTAGPWGLLPALAYPLRAARVARRSRGAGLPPRDAWLYGAACVVSHFPQVVGALRYQWGRLLNLRRSIIEYKGT